jgi:hypothetical protein
MAAQPKLDASSTKPQAKPTEAKPVQRKPDGAAKPRTVTGTGNPFPKPISASPAAKPAAKPTAKPSDKPSS